jgi:hypothetical protein
MISELSGRIVLENMNVDRHQGNWELAISDNKADLDPIKSSFNLSGRKFRYYSKLSVMVDITLHPSPKNVPTPAAN